jgi:hypothetical protein
MMMTYEGYYSKRGRNMVTEVKEGTPLYYAIMGFRNKCVSCGCDITPWQRFKRLFWAPQFCPTSMVWQGCCSKNCWTKELEKQLVKVREEYNG